MKCLIKVTLFSFLASFVLTTKYANASSLGEVNKTGLYLNEINVGSGYAWWSLKSYPNNLAVYPAFLRIGFNINSLACIDGSRSQLQLELEPFINSIADPNGGVETGVCVGLRYLHKLYGPLDSFTEASVAPMFLSIKTAEQGNAAFNFLDQLGVGLQYKVASRTAIFAGYSQSCLFRQYRTPFPVNFEH